MTKTSREIQGDIYKLLQGSSIPSAISGSIYRNGCRPRDSRLEDIIVTFTAGLPEQIQTGVVTINVFVPDIDPEGNGIHLEDIERTETLERLMSEWVESLSTRGSGYKYHLMQTIHTQEEPEIQQHFIVVRLGYEFFDE